MSDKQTKLMMIVAVVLLVMGIILVILVPDVQILQNVVGLEDTTHLVLGAL